MKNAKDTTLTLSKSTLIMGPPGSGKTTMAAALYPKPFILNVDNNVIGPIRYLRSVGIDPDFTYGDVMFAESAEELIAIGMPSKDVPTSNASGVIPVPRIWRYRRAAGLLEDAIKGGAETIIIDSLTSLNDVVKDEVRRQYNIPMGEAIGKNLIRTVDPKPLKESFQLWEGYLSLMKNFVFSLKSTGLNIVCIGHTQTKDDGDGTLEEFICIPGQFASQIAGYFEEVWKLETANVLNKETSKWEEKRFIRTRAGERQSNLGLKSAAGLEVREPLDLVTLRAKLYGKSST